MAGRWWDSFGDTPGMTQDSGDSASQSASATPDQVSALYQQLLGRAPENASAVQNWISGTHGNLAAIRQGIANSAEGQAYAAKSQQPPAPPTPPPAAGGASSGSSGQNAQQTLQQLLASGMDPQQAVAQVNQQYGLQTGSSGQYYAPGAHGVGSGAVIGLAGYGGYFAQHGDGSWGWVPSAEQSSVNIGGGPGVSSLGNLGVAGGYTPNAPYQPPTAPAYQPVSLAQLAAPPPLTLPTAQDVQNTPGYQFTRDQGLLAVQRANAPYGLSGGTLKAGADYAENLANTYYQNAVSNAINLNQANFGNALNAYNASNNAALSAAGLNLQGTNQQFQNTYQPSWASYLSTVGQNQFGANYGLNLANLGLQAQNQYWGQGLAENQNAFNQYNTNQNAAFQQLLALANLGNVGNPYA